MGGGQNLQPTIAVIPQRTVSMSAISTSLPRHLLLLFSSYLAKQKRGLDLARVGAQEGGSRGESSKYLSKI